MLCIDRLNRRVAIVLLACVTVLVAGCATRPRDAVSTTPSPAPGKTPQPSRPARPAPSGGLPAPSAARNWAEVRLQAARRIMAANPDITYTSTPPDILMAIPVLTVQLNGDGSIRRIEVLRYPSQARETVDMAIQAVRRAAPFGDVSRLPKPWEFNETFLFDDDHKFKPKTLDIR